MKLSDLRGIDFGTISEDELRQTHRFLKSQYGRSRHSFHRNNLNPVVLQTTERMLDEASHITSDFSRMQSEASAMYHFFFTRVPGALSDSRAETSTVAGYRNVIRQTGQTLGISNYNRWTEEQRADLWDIIDRVRELGADRFLPNGYGSYLYQSGTSFRTISIIINDLGITDPTEIMNRLNARIEAVEAGNSMTDREFFGI